VTTVGEIDRLRIALPMLNVVTIGAGGGSIGWIDEGGLLRMGPQSAGAKPGPVCYGLGGDQPTCTDADLVLGYLDPGFFAGGRIRLDADAALRAIEERIARPLGLQAHQAAAGMYDLINTNMAAAVREVAVKQGQDPRDFPLVIAGGAGPNHACQIALELEIPLIIVPRESSIFCAAGMLMSDLKHSFVKTYATPLREADPGRFCRLFEEMRRAGERLLAAEGFEPGRARLVHSLDLRYVNQYHEVEVEIPAGAVEACDFDAMAKLFHPVHNALFGYSLEDEGAPVELINMRLATIGITDKPRFQPMEPAGDDPAGAFKRMRRAWLPRRGEFAEVPVYDGFELACGNRIAGPAIIEQVNTTTFVTPEFRVLVDRFGNYTVYLPEREGEATRRGER
jgi:N-methylhydantoinase A